MQKLAEKYHAGQFRDGADCHVPYIEHPKAVVQNLLDWGEKADSTAVAIAWGHDLLEDTAVSEAELLTAGGKEVFDGITLLTRHRFGDTAVKRSKKDYLYSVAASNNRNSLLVKISDRIQNTRDFLRNEGAKRAFDYLHEADCIFNAAAALCEFDKNSAIPADTVLENALAAWRSLDRQITVTDKEKIRGCLLGGAVGDALGAPVEFMDIEQIRQKYGENGVTGYVEFADGTGAITDDTQMTLFTAEGILRAMVRGKEKGICGVSGVVYGAYRRWLKTQGYLKRDWSEMINSGWLIKERRLFVSRAPGMTCLSALEQNSLNAVNNSKGCGSVMRMAPAGLFYDPQGAYELGCEFSAITHGHPTGITAGGAFAMLIAYLYERKNLAESLRLVEEHLEKIPDASETLAAMRRAKTAKSITELGEGWVAEEALSIGIYCALHNEFDFRSGVLEAVNISGDSDSTGSIAGNILGVINGEKSIPEKWLENLREYRIVSQIADDMYIGFEEDQDGYVTDSWWNKYPGF